MSTLKTEKKTHDVLSFAFGGIDLISYKKIALPDHDYWNNPDDHVDLPVNAHVPGVL